MLGTMSDSTQIYIYLYTIYITIYMYTQMYVCAKVYKTSDNILIGKQKM